MCPLRGVRWPLRLGALRYTVDDYLSMSDDAGFRDVRVSEFLGDEILVEEIPSVAGSRPETVEVRAPNLQEISTMPPSSLLSLARAQYS
jgi:hypothetical protein